MDFQNDNKDKEKILKSFKNDNSSLVSLGQYIPIHKLSATHKNKELKTVTSPMEEEPKLYIYEGDYLKKEQIIGKDLYSGIGSNFVVFLKSLFKNLPIINLLFLKIKQSKIRESLSALDSFNEDVDKFAGFFQGKSVINEKKYQKICADLIKANNIQTRIKKEFLDNM